MASDSKKEVLANTLSGPRVYSTDFHPSHFPNPKLAEDQEAQIIRSLKAKFLTKGIVTINGGHLLNPPVVQLLREHEELLTDGLLLPARRVDKHSFGDYLEDHKDAIKAAGWTTADETAAASFVEDRVSLILPWRVEQALEAYRTRLLAGLEEPRSLVRTSLLKTAGFGQAELQRIIDKVAELDLNEDHSMARYIDGQPENLREILHRFSHACYHVVGTSVVNCETGTDLSALAEIRINDLTENAVNQRDEILSDINIFHRCCFATAMQAISDMAIPITFLDAIPIKRMRIIQDGLRDRGFQQKYDGIVKDFLSRIAAGNDPTSLSSWDTAKTVTLVEELSAHFKEHIGRELGHYKTEVEKKHEHGAIHSFAETVKSGLHLIPGISELIAGVEMIKSYVGFVGHARKAVAAREPGVAAEHAERERAREAEEFIKAIKPSNEAVILEALGALRKIAATEIRPI
jgi:hypothetical protein